MRATGVIALSDDTTEPEPGSQPDMHELYLNLLNNLYKGDLNAAGIDVTATVQTARTYMKGVYEGYGESLTTVRYDTPDYDKLVHLDKNVYSFSTAKNWHMMRELTSAIKDGDRIRPFTEFKNKAITILEEYNGRTLQTEYNAAVAGAQMASKWVDFEQHPDALLEYRTMEDGRVRPEHAALDKITRPVDDTFWKTYYPPNGWNCRCTVIRLNDGKKTSTKLTNQAMAAVTPQKGFGTNLAKDGFVFPKSSAYYVNLPDDIYSANIKVQRTDIRWWAKENLAGKKMASEIGDIYISKKNLHAAIGKGHNDEFEKNMATYKLADLLKEGKLVGSAKDVSDSNVKWHYLEVKIAGKRSYLNIKEDMGLNKKYFHAITDKLK